MPFSCKMFNKIFNTIQCCLIQLGFKAEHIKIPKNTSEGEIINIIDKLNADTNVHGIIVQLPLDTDEKVDSAKVINTVLPTKDVDW